MAADSRGAPKENGKGSLCHSADELHTYGIDIERSSYPACGARHDRASTPMVVPGVMRIDGADVQLAQVGQAPNMPVREGDWRERRHVPCHWQPWTHCAVPPPGWSGAGMLDTNDRVELARCIRTAGKWSPDLGRRGGRRAKIVNRRMPVAPRPIYRSATLGSRSRGLERCRWFP